MSIGLVSLIKTRNPVNAGNHFLQATEPEHERDALAALVTQKVAEEHKGTLLQPRPDMPVRVAERIGAAPDRPLRADEVYALVDGKRLDGGRLERPGDNRGREPVKFIAITLAPDVSLSVAHANARTRSGQALLEHSFLRAAHRTMLAVEERAIIARDGTPGRTAWWTGVHRTTRPFADGTSAPELHAHILMPNAMLTQDGRLRAIDGHKLLNLQRQHEIGRLFGHFLRQEMRAIGVRVQTRPDGAVVLPDVPETVRQHFSRRSREGLEAALAYTEGRGEVWEELTEAQQRARVSVGVQQTAAGSRDGMADRAAWRADCARLGFEPTDVAGQVAREHSVAPAASMVERSAALRAAAVATRLHATQVREEREINPEPFVQRRAAAALAPSKARQFMVVASRMLVRTAAAAYQRLENRRARQIGAGIRMVLLRTGLLRGHEEGRGVPRAPAAALDRGQRPARNTITSEQAAVVHAALRRLAGIDDGARTTDGKGFNRDDTARGNTLAAQASLTREEALEGRRMLRKYWRQIGPETLESMGASLSRPAGPQSATEPTIVERSERLVQRAQEATSPEAVRQRAEGMRQRRDEMIAAAVAEATRAPQENRPVPNRTRAPIPRAASRDFTPRPTAPRGGRVRMEISQVEAEAQLRDALRQFGLKPEGHEIVWDDKIHYLPTITNKANERSGGYIAHWDGFVPAASIFNWQITKSEKGWVGDWKANGELKSITPEEAARIRADSEAAKAQREEVARQKTEAAARKAQKLYSNARQEDGSHPYLVAKGLAPVAGLRRSGDLLVVPFYDDKGEIRNTQVIDFEGGKKYGYHAQKQGVAFQVGQIKDGSPVIIAEGFATALRVHHATGEGVLMAADAGNLTAVARSVRARMPDREIIFAADNDAHLTRRDTGPQYNVGLVKAQKAAEEVGNARVWFPEELPERRSVANDRYPAGQAAGTDWDDVGKARGNATVRALYAAMVERDQGPTLPKPWAELARNGREAGSAPPSQQAMRRVAR